MLACPSVSLWLHWKKALPVCGGRSGGNGSRPEGRPIHLEGLLVQKEGFGIFFGDYEEFECRLLGAAKALLPAADGVGADVEIGGEEGLAGVEIAAICRISRAEMGRGRAGMRVTRRFTASPRS